MNEHIRRDADSTVSKLMNLWPLIVALVSMIAMATTIKNRVDDHEARIGRLENSMDSIKTNTDRLVDELLDKK